MIWLYLINKTCFYLLNNKANLLNTFLKFQINVKKQIIYTKFIDRMFAAVIDLAIFALIFRPVKQFIIQPLFIYIFRSFFINYGIDVKDDKAITAALKTQEFYNYLSSVNLVSYFLILTIINIIAMGLYCILFWYKYSATPGKMIMRMKIVDSDTYEKLSLSRVIKRFLGYTTAVFGVWQIIFSKKSQAMHDKLANSVVIKS